MFRGKNGFTNACWAQLGILLTCFLPWYYIRTAAFLAGPPFIDTYAQTWSYQLVMGAILLVGALLALAVLLIIEACLLKLYRRIAASKHRALRS
jgi:hypothetical protein